MLIFVGQIFSAVQQLIGFAGQTFGLNPQRTLGI